jgi:ubiquinone/menaquinone biosynthesis C-methylase UbiE
MDATDLKYDDAQFDQVAAIALTHHMPDASAAAMVKEALRVLKPRGRLHIVEPIIPNSPFALFKTFWFKIDRGRFARCREHLSSLIGAVGAIEELEEYQGPLHDVCYLRVAPKREDAAAYAGRVLDRIPVIG